jgi:multiple sugar transport system ATP-binding protein
MTRLDLDGLHRAFGPTTAVDDVSLTVDSGELLVIVGPSGCGKSTLLRCVAGLDDPTAGDLRVDGQSVVGVPPEVRDVAMVFQNYALYPHMTARENLGFGLRMTTSLSAEAITERVESVAETLGIEALLGKRPKALSGGQQQRVALGRAIVREPSLFLLDEPLSNLDATLRAEMRTEIQQLQASLGVTTLYVTHDQVEAMTIGDRLAVMRDGQLEQVGTPQECYFEPASRFVAGFLGEPSMNFLSVRREGDRLAGDVEMTLPAGLGDLPTGRGLTLGVRPEAVELADTDDARRGTVRVVEPVGDGTYIHVDVGTTTLTAAVEGDVRVSPGTTARVRLPPERLHVFDADGRALANAEPPDAGVAAGAFGN